MLGDMKFISRGDNKRSSLSHRGQTAWVSTRHVVVYFLLHTLPACRMCRRRRRRRLWNRPRVAAPALLTG